MAKSRAAAPDYEGAHDDVSARHQRKASRPADSADFNLVRAHAILDSQHPKKVARDSSRPYLGIHMNRSLISRVQTAIALAAIVSAPCRRLTAQTPAKAAVVIAGVTDAQSVAPLADAQVSVYDLHISARSDCS